MESSFQLMIAYDRFYYVKFTALSIKTICRALSLSVLKILELGRQATANISSCVSNAKDIMA